MSSGFEAGFGGVLFKHNEQYLSTTTTTKKRFERGRKTNQGLDFEAAGSAVEGEVILAASARSTFFCSSSSLYLSDATSLSRRVAFSASFLALASCCSSRAILLSFSASRAWDCEGTEDWEAAAAEPALVEDSSCFSKVVACEKIG